MKRTENKIVTLNPYTFMGLLAAEGQVPGATSLVLEEAVKADKFDAVWKYVSDTKEAFKTGGDFFDLMVEANQMKAEGKLPEAA